MSYRAGSPFYFEFCTSNPTTGAAADADATPTAVVNRNGVDDLAVTVTVTHIDTARYVASGTFPATYAADDVVNLHAVATVAGVTAKKPIANVVIGQKLFPTFQLTGKVKLGTTPTATAMTITLDAASALNAGMVAADFTGNGGLFLTFTGGARLPVPARIDGCTINTTSEIALTFNAGKFAAAPAAGDPVMISG